eukprot:c14828_g1_i3.p1 GENE.c14828_g1_i3~~c14828_g1_i3.p1  ORF type:complete len:592 (+),score=108.42 c14828_g1_i3:31-1806(+)
MKSGGVHFADKESVVPRQQKKPNKSKSKNKKPTADLPPVAPSLIEDDSDSPQATAAVHPLPSQEDINAPQAHENPSVDDPVNISTEPVLLNNAIPFPVFEVNNDSILFTVLTLLSLYSRCTGLSDIKYLIFDEVHFGKFMNGHITGHFYFDIHPPLIKLVMAGFVKYFTPWYNGEQPFQDIGEEYLPDSPVKAMRFIPAISSALVVPVTYITCRQMGISCWASTVCSAMVLLDNLQVTEGRVLTTDTSLLLLMALAFLFHLLTESSRIFSARWHVCVLLTGIFCGLTLSTKWISLNVVGVVGICTAVDVIQRGHLGFSLKHGFNLDSFSPYDLVLRLTLLLGVPFLIYYVNFYYWIETTPKWSDFGPGFMSTAFQATLEGSPTKSTEPREGFFDTFVRMNWSMYTGNRDVGKGIKGHPWESWWYQWPLDLRGLACWSSGAKFNAAKGNSFESHIYFLGNPFVYWFSAACLVLWLVAALTPRKPKNSIPNFGYKSFVLLLGFFSGWLPYALVRRSCFNYHYMPPFHFLVILCGLVLDHLFFRYVSNYRAKLALSAVLIGSFLWAFWFFSITTYGTLVTKNTYDARIWRSGWR